MRFKTTDGLQYAVDMEKRLLQSPDACTGDLRFEKVVCVYAGSPGAIFYGAYGVELFKTGPIAEVIDSPLDQVSGSTGNVVVHTQNSVYEINQEEKLIRRLAGTNNPTTNQEDGDWIAYDQITGVDKGDRAVIWYDDPTKSQTITSTIRAVEGTFITPPAREVFKVEFKTRLDKPPQ